MVKTHKHESIAHGEMEICHSGTYKLTGLLSPAIATTVGAKKKGTYRGRGKSEANAREMG